MSSAHQYASWVLDPANSFRTGRLIKLAAQRFLDDLKRDDIYFDEKEAVRCVNFIERYCMQWEGDWRDKPFTLELWQKFALEQIYGWIRKDNGRRRFNKAYIQISKKNGKSSLSAGVSLFHLFADDKVNTPKVFTAANNEDQAKICVNIAGRIVERSPDLFEWVEDGDVKLFNYKDNITEIVHAEKDGFIKALSKESGDKTAKTSGGKHGINASLGVVDEFGLSPDYGASKAIETSMASRSERLMLYITTAGYNLEGPCYRELRESGVKMLEGTLKLDNYFALIFEIDPPIVDDKVQEVTVDWLLEHEEVWQQSNPNLDVSVGRDFLRDQLRDAKQYGGTTERENLTLNFNIWVFSASSFISADIWNKNQYGLTVEDGEECYGGLEIATERGMLSAFCLLFPGDKVKIKMLFFVEDEALKTNDLYKQHKDFIKFDPGNVVDNDIAEEWIAQEIQKYSMHSFCFPKTQENNSIVQGLIKRGYQGNPISQGVNGIANATDEYEKLVRAEGVEHFGNPILRWQNSNCMAVRKEAGTRLEKNGKVLGIWACIDAIAQWKTIEAEGGSEVGIVFI
jgi:phage terminase large subunit-like protein